MNHDHHDVVPAPDHRDLNQHLEIFATNPVVGSGLPLWLPNGSAVRDELERLARDIAQADGCRGVHSPVLAKRSLFERSGHWGKFAEDMFPPMRIGGDDFVLRPANCPHHALIYAAARHSYRELPIRFNELAPMFRAERSGVLSGLTRVRQINLDDTHVFCRFDQVADEAARALRSALRAQEILGLRVDYVRLSRRDASPAFLGEAEQWQHAEEALREAVHAVELPSHGLELAEVAGEAAFYGPKLDLQVRDEQRHDDTIATVQLDFNQPERFGLTYDAADGSRRPVLMIHRGTVGSMERVVAALLERYRGRLPLWLAPVQVCVMPVGPAQDRAARELVDELIAAGLRPRLEVDGSLGARIRASRHRRDSVMAVLGAAEVDRHQVQVTDIDSGFDGPITRGQFLEALAQSYRTRTTTVHWPEPQLA